MYCSVANSQRNGVLKDLRREQGPCMYIAAVQREAAEYDAEEMPKAEWHRQCLIFTQK